MQLHQVGGSTVRLHALEYTRKGKNHIIAWLVQHHTHCTLFVCSPFLLLSPSSSPLLFLPSCFLSCLQNGSGSGDFHLYRRARNQERSRIAEIEAAAEEEEKRNEFERQRAITQYHLEQETLKRSEKRKRKKAHQQEAKKQIKLQINGKEGEEGEKIVVKNDGSFLETFLKMQAEKEKEKDTAATRNADLKEIEEEQDAREREESQDRSKLSLEKF